ncbi:MAG: DUF2203 domain-containing protein [bacterium]|jgi:hypothetical protein|nr:DUF2203 domain-containing protein [bacterium]
MPFFDKHFTVSEANECLPRVRELFAQIHALVTISKQTQFLQSLPAPPLPTAQTNGKHNKPKDLRPHLQALITEITDQGIVIQDISRGLIDFPAFIEGEEVFLCYELADGDTVRFYHPLQTGFGGRKPIPDSAYF